MNTLDLSLVNWFELMNYCGISGLLSWKVDASPSARIGGKVGSISKNGYLKTSFKRKTYSLHRIIFYLATGEQPEQIDHINGVKTDNRIENLRPANCTKNQYNKPVMKTSLTGIKGVSFDGYGYRARARIGGKRINIGYFKSSEEAKKAAIDFRLANQQAFAYEARI